MADPASMTCAAASRPRGSSPGVFRPILWTQTPTPVIEKGGVVVAFVARVLWLAWCWIELAVFTFVLYILAFLPKPWLRSWYFRLFRHWCRFFVRALGVDLRLHQKNTRPLPRHYILIANHPSALEDVGIPTLFPVTSLAKEEVKEWWWAGRINIAAGTLFVKRESAESRKAATEQLEAEVRKGHNVALYPEGGCKGRRIFSAFRYGAFKVSLATGVPIVPVFLYYESQDDFEWHSPQTLLDKFWHFMTAQNARANYYVYDAIDPKQFANTEEYNQHVYELYLKWQARYLD
jgi:1-acyl-sn-glycerol-3-phosphate acyltransferase